MATNISGIFACGNVVHVNDLVDNVSTESELAGKFAALYAQGKYNASSGRISVIAGDNVRYVTPNTISTGNIDDGIKFYFRVTQPAKDVFVTAMINGKQVYIKKKKAVNPGEIECVEIKKETLLRDRIQELKVSVTA
jgi:sarcosine oxidase subunit alpha